MSRFCTIGSKGKFHPSCYPYCPDLDLKEPVSPDGETRVTMQDLDELAQKINEVAQRLREQMNQPKYNEPKNEAF
jgi:hypothetical protein